MPHTLNIQHIQKKRMVWLYDANVDYLLSKHIPLFLVAVFIFSCLFSNTILLLFGQWLQVSQKCQAETFDGFIPCSLQSKTLLLARIAVYASLSSSSCVRFKSSFQQDGTNINLLVILVVTGVLVDGPGPMVGFTGTGV